jgi:hypothetical protein
MKRDVVIAAAAALAAAWTTPVNLGPTVNSPSWMELNRITAR